MIRFDNVVFWFTAGVKDIDRYHEKLTLSLYSSALPPHLDKVKLGVISKEDLPLHYTYVKTVKWALTRLSQTSCCWWFPPLFQPGWKGGRRQQRDAWEAFGELSWFVQPFKCGLPPGKARYKWHTNAFTNEGLAEVRVFGCYFIHRFLGVYSVKLFFLFIHSKRFKEDDFATAIRKKQSVSWALKWFVSLIFHHIPWN